MHRYKNGKVKANAPKASLREGKVLRSKKEKQMRNPSSSSSSSRTQLAVGVEVGVGSSSLTSKTIPCCTKVGLKRGPWTPEEDELLTNYIKKEGEGQWRTLPKKAGLLRCGKSCRLRWMNYLRPSVRRGNIGPDEEDLILRLHRLLGNRWSLIAGRIPGRTDNEIKNYWNTYLSKKLISQGIDPRTHKPLEPNSSCEKDKVSSSTANYISAPNASNHVPSGVEEAGNEGFTPDNNHYQSAGNENGSSMQNAAGTGMDLRSNYHEGISNQDNDDINYCSDDIFSTFLNSLINEDVFSSQGLVQQQHPNGIISNSDPLISFSQAFTFSPGWDAQIVVSPSALDQNDLERLCDHVDKQI